MVLLLGVVLFHRFRQETKENLSGSKYPFPRSPIHIAVVHKGEYINQTTTFWYFILHIKINTSRKEKLHTGHARYRVNTKILIIFLSFSITTFLHLLNYGVLYFPPPVNNYWICHSSIYLSFSVFLLLLKIGEEKIVNTHGNKNRLLHLNWTSLFLSSIEKSACFWPRLWTREWNSNSKYQWNLLI